MELKNAKFLDILNCISDKNGIMVGGSTSCIASISSLSLLEMVVCISNISDNISDDIQVLKDEFFKLELQDRNAFLNLKKLFSQKKTMEENRYQILFQERLYDCFLPCYYISKSCYESILICETIFPKIDKFLVGDVSIACLHLNSTLKSAYINAIANARSIKDKTKINSYMDEIKSFVNNGELKSNSIYRDIINFDNL